MVFRGQITGFYTDSSQLINISSIPFAVMLLNYMFALPGYVYINAVTGTGKTRIAFWFQLITIVIYLFYLYLLSHYTASLAVYLTAEYLFVILLAVQSRTLFADIICKIFLVHGHSFFFLLKA